MEPRKSIEDIVRGVAMREVTIDANGTPFTLLISGDDLSKVCDELYKNPSCYFDMLSCITGVDNGPEANTMEVIYNLYSIPHNTSVMVRVVLERTTPQIPTVSGIWKGADWLEREVYDMFGIHFSNHPNLKRILLPADWEGHPLRKDYQHQEQYRDIQVKY